jgi:hypothetical protein
MAAYVALEIVLGLVAYVGVEPFVLADVARAAGWILMAPSVILALPIMNGLDPWVFGLGGGQTAVGLAYGALFGIFAFGNGCALTYLRSADGRY